MTDIDCIFCANRTSGGVQGGPPPDVSLWHVDYFQLKIKKAPKTQEPFTSFLQPEKNI